MPRATCCGAGLLATTACISTSIPSATARQLVGQAPKNETKTHFGRLRRLGSSSDLNDSSANKCKGRNLDEGGRIEIRGKHHSRQSLQELRRLTEEADNLRQHINGLKVQPQSPKTVIHLAASRAACKEPKATGPRGFRKILKARGSRDNLPPAGAQAVAPPMLPRVEPAVPGAHGGRAVPPGPLRAR